MLMIPFAAAGECDESRPQKPDSGREATSITVKGRPLKRDTMLTVKLGISRREGGLSMCYSARNLREVPMSRFWSNASSFLPFLRFHLVLFVLILLGVMIGCGGSGSSSSSTPPPPPPSLTITSFANTSPLPLTPVQISTSGLDVNSAVTVQFSD